MIVLQALAAYALVGVIVAVAFVAFGVTRILPHVSVTPGARLFLLPGACALWPVIVVRWFGKSR